MVANNKSIFKSSVTPELLNLLEWDLGPEDAIQIDLLPKLHVNGRIWKHHHRYGPFLKISLRLPSCGRIGHKHGKTMIHIMTKYTYLPTTLITDKGVAFTLR